MDKPKIFFFLVKTIYFTQEGAFTDNDTTFWFESLESATDDFQHEIIIGKREDRKQFGDGESGLKNVVNQVSEEKRDRDEGQLSA